MERRLTVAMVVLLASCNIEPELVRCGDYLCSADQVCLPGGRCATQEQISACAELADGEGCTVDGRGNGQCLDSVCWFARCGDGVVDPGEACDDGNALDGDGCSRDCQSNEICGNAVRDAGEQCDDGNAANGDGCQQDCKLPRCGDGIVDVQLGEECDDGDANANAADACRVSCRLPYCGDQIRDVVHGEACDDGNLTAGDGCTPDCSSDESCGNGKVDPFTSEVCDDGNLRNRDGCSPSCQPELPVWTQQGRPLVGRQDPAVAFDRGRGRVVVHGGFASSAFLGDTWEWNGTGWSASASGPTLSGTGAFAVYDSGRAQVMIRTTSGDQAVWDGSTWTVVSSSNSPPGVAAMAYDPVHRQVVTLLPNEGDPALASTWIWDGTEWTENVTGPPPRQSYAITWDAGVQRVVLFGGFYDDGNGAIAYADTWDWDGTTWAERAPANTPPAIGTAGLAYDDARGRLVLFGDNGSTTYTWEWIVDNWVQVTPAAAPPSAFSVRKPLVYNTVTQRIELFRDFDTLPWQYDGATWIHAAPPQVPVKRTDSPIVYELSRDRFFMFSGNFGGGGPTPNETWEWDGAAWLLRTPATSPTRRYGHGLAFDIARDRVVMFGGANFGVEQNETWEWDGTNWLQSTPAASPSARAYVAMAYDPHGQRTILFGGQSAGTANAETWAWDGTTWTQLAPANSPPAAANATLVYDPEQGGLVLHADGQWLWTGNDWTEQTAIARPTTMLAWLPGGAIGVGGSELTDKMNDFWRWDGSDWLHQTLASYPVYRSGAAFAYDPLRDRLLMFGGYSNNHGWYNETWTLRWSSSYADDTCAIGGDSDRDGKADCMDDDCWQRCSPLCPPGAAQTGACGATADPPYCGDATCAIYEVNTCSLDCP